MRVWIGVDDELPKDCEIVAAKVMVRYKYYKPESMQYKSGIKGRWQMFNGYGWNNMDEPPVEYQRISK